MKFGQRRRLAAANWHWAQPEPPAKIRWISLDFLRKMLYLRRQEELGGQKIFQIIWKHTFIVISERAEVAGWLPGRPGGLPHFRAGSGLFK